MATWIVHLRLAENLLGMIEGLDVAQFAVGNIAPDSGIPDEKWENFTPPGEVTHFKASDGARYPYEDLSFYHRYLATWTDPGDDAPHFSFLLGYFFHLVTDNLWYQQVAQPTQTRFAAQFEADPEFGWEVKRDWYGLDFIYVRDHPDALFWRVFVDCEYTHDYLDFMPVEAVRQRIEYIQTFYQRQDERIQAAYARPYIYLSQAEMDRFVKTTTWQLDRIYQYLRKAKADTTGFFSALELPLPLGQDVH